MDDAGIATRHVADQLGQSRTSITQDVYVGRKVIATKAAAVLENLALPDGPPGPGDAQVGVTSFESR